MLDLTCGWLNYSLREFMAISFLHYSAKVPDLRDHYDNFKS
jgi:hypothetical protein